MRRIVGEKILGAQFVADLVEGIVQLRDGRGIEVFAAGVRGELNKGVLPAYVPPGTCFNGNDNDAIQNGLGFQGGAHRFLVVHLAHGVAAIRDDHHDLSPLPRLERLRAQV